VSDAAAKRAGGIPTDLRFVAIGAYFGFVLLKAEAVSWYRFQEMFRFQSFHMYGVMGATLLVAALTVWAVRRFGLRSIDGQPITFEAMPAGWRRYAGWRPSLRRRLGADGRLRWPDRGPGRHRPLAVRGRVRVGAARHLRVRAAAAPAAALNAGARVRPTEPEALRGLRP
jgi:hypothetical protein